MDIYLTLRIGLNVAELAAAAAGFAYWRKIGRSYWKYFPVYLAVILLTEAVAEYAGYRLHEVRFNILLYRYFGIPVQFLFFCWLFWRHFKGTATARWPLAGAVLYLLCWLADIFYLSGVRLAFFSFSYMAGSAVLLTLVILFLFRFMRSDAILHYRRSAMFWVAAGLLVFYLLSLPLYGLWNTLAYGYPQLFNHYSVVVFFFNYLMYILFILAFVWGEPK